MNPRSLIPPAAVHASRAQPTFRWLVVAWLSLVSYCFLVGVVNAQNEISIPRVKVHIYKYKGIHSKEQETAFGQFTGIIHDKIINLAQSLAGQGDEYKYLIQLRPHPITGTDGKQLEFVGSLAELEDYHKATNALEVLTGRLRGESGKYSVRSRVYLGSLGQALKNGTMSLDLQIDDSEYDRTTDSHSLITLYALAMDAKRLDYPPEVVYHYLGEAFLRMPDVPDDLKGVPEVKAAIKQALKELKPTIGQGR